MIDIWTAHAKGLAAIQKESVAGVAAVPGAAAAPGTVTYAGNSYPANIGPFMLQDVLRGGGFVPETLAMVTVNKSDLPAGTAFQTGQQITVTPPASIARLCQIKSVDDGFSFWQITVMDAAENAIH